MLFDENNELGFFKIFDQSCCTRQGNNGRIWWKLFTHKAQFGDIDTTVFDHPSGFVGEHVEGLGEYDRQYLMNIENLSRIEDQSRRRQEHICSIS